ncbi:hypothetical protein JCM10212_000636 [Sporobolomyces blumeae]
MRTSQIHRADPDSTIEASLVLICCFIFITFFAHNLPMLLAGELLCGLPWGVFQTLTTAYAAEIAPTALRPFLTTYINLCWVMGQFISSGVIRGTSMLPVTSSLAYRIPFALQWVWPVPILIGVIFAPESPWWYVRNGKTEDAKTVLCRLGSEKPGAINAEERVAQMVHTNEIGKSTVFYQEAGLSAADSFSFNLGMYALGAIDTIAAWWTMQWFGRRTLVSPRCTGNQRRKAIARSTLAGHLASLTSGSFRARLH